MNVSFDYGRACVRDLKLVGERSFKSGKISMSAIEAS